MVDVLEILAKDPANFVLVISSESKYLMHKWYHSRAPHVALAAENGFFWRLNSLGKKEQEWSKLIDADDFFWIEQVKVIMKQYKDKTDGSFIQQKQTSIIWNCSNADFEFG